MGKLTSPDDEEPGIPWNVFLGLWTPAVVLSTGVILVTREVGLVEAILYALSLPSSLAVANALHRRRAYRAREAKRSVS